MPSMAQRQSLRADYECDDDLVSTGGICGSFPASVGIPESPDCPRDPAPAPSDMPPSPSDGPGMGLCGAGGQPVCAGEQLDGTHHTSALQERQAWRHLYLESVL